MLYRRSVFFYCCLIFLSGSAFAQKWPGIVLYNLEVNSISKHLIIDPAVRIDKGKYSYPVPTPPEAFEGTNSHEVLEGLFNRFDKEEYPQGRNLEVYVGGNRCGTATVTVLDTLNSCSPVVSEVEVSDSSCFYGQGLAIVTATPLKKFLQFAIDSAREASILQYGKNEFLRRGIKKEIADKIYIFELRGSDLDGDGKPEYLVTYTIIGEEVHNGEYDMQYSLTTILQPDSAGYTPVFTHYPDPGIPPETHYYHMVDALDFDGEGICKVLYQKRNLSSWDYVLVKKVDGVWTEVYEGAGGGC